MEIPIHKRKQPVAKSGHMWIKAASNGYFCPLCKCTKTTRTRNGENVTLWTTIDGTESRYSPECKK